MLKTTALILAILIMGCASRSVSPSGRSLLSESEYNDIIYKNSDSVRKYSGFSNTLDVHATLLTPEVVRAQNDNSVRMLMWDEQKAQEELNKELQKQQTSTEVYLSFYVPDRRFDDLWKEKTTWRVFLDVSGRRVEGKPTKLRLPLQQLIAYYPYHNRFYSPYMISFPVPASTLENHKVTLTITGVSGGGTLEFDSQK